MPTRKRKVASLGRRLEKAYWDSIVRNAPPHIKALEWPACASKLLDDLYEKPLNRVGVKFSEEDGQLVKHEWEDKELGANIERHENAEATAQELKARYPHHWGKRGTAKIIASFEGKSVRTIQKYFKKFP